MFHVAPQTSEAATRNQGGVCTHNGASSTLYSSNLGMDSACRAANANVVADTLELHGSLDIEEDGREKMKVFNKPGLFLFGNPVRVPNTTKVNRTRINDISIAEGEDRERHEKLL